MPELDYKAQTFYLHVFEFICIGIVAVYSWLANRHKANTEAISKVNEKFQIELNGLDDRLIKLEESIEHMPTQKDMQSSHRRIDECAQAICKLEGTLGQVNNSVQMIHQHLLDAAKVNS